MPDAYELHEGRFIQRALNTSAADALQVWVPAVPAGKIWTLLSGFVTCSVAETQIYWAGIQSMGTQWPILRPASFALAPAVYQNLPLVTEGMEIKIFAGEVLAGYRAAATGGSTMSIYVRYIENDLPLYEYIEPQEVRRLRRSAQAAIGSMVRGGGGGGGSSGGGIAPPGGGRVPPAR